MPVNPRKSASNQSSASVRNPRDDEGLGRAEATRRAILDAALHVFNEQTYGGARIEQIAARAGVAMGTIYKYFPGKQALANEVFRYWRTVTNTYDYPRGPGVPARERWHAWFNAFCRFAIEHPEAMQFLQTHHHAAYLDDESRRMVQPADRAAMRTIAEGQKEGAIRDGDPGLLEAMVVGLMVGLVRELVARGEKIDEESLAFAEEIGWDVLRRR